MTELATPLAAVDVDLAVQDKAAVAARIAEIARLRVNGASYQQIADRMGYTDRNGPRMLLMRHMRAQAVENVAEMRLIENERLDAVHLVATSIMQDKSHTPMERLRAGETIIRNSARRSALNGLDAPITMEVRQGMQAAFAELSQLVLGEVISVDGVAVDGMAEKV